MMPADIHGILLLDKPLGLSSAGAVARVKRLFNARKAGHTGSLDPLASGLLPICFGEATKFGAQLLDADKTYRVTVRLGERTPSADRESEVIERRELPHYSAPQLAEALRDFPREYAQVPPMHSALKQDGKPLYEYARAGLTRERAARAIVIRDMCLLDWQPPDLTFDVRCSKGAYIRVLAEDLAAQLGTIAHVAALRRLGVEPFGAEPQWSFEVLESLNQAQRQDVLLPVDAALTAWRRLDLSAGGVSAFRQGQTVSIPVDLPEALPGTVRIYADGLGFLGLGQIEAAGRLMPLRLIANQGRIRA
jgi:tRNA pseudouridine55 synthase